MKNKINFKTFYNVSSFLFFRRQINSEEKEKGLIKYINEKDTKSFDVEKTKPNKSQRNIIKKFNPEFLFQSYSLEGVDKIRDLFLEFDFDKSFSFDVDELHSMFHANLIPITKSELTYIFNFTKRKNSVSFSELMEHSFEKPFLEKFKRTIEKVKKRCEPGVICPTNFIDMLIHLCEFKKLENTVKKLEKKIDKLDDYHQKSYEEDTNSKTIYTGLNSLTKKTNKTQFKPKHNKFRSITKTFKNALEISEEKLKKSVEKNYINIREINNNKKKSVTNSLKLIHKNNPKIKLDYISFDVIKNTFNNMNKGNIIDINKTLNYQNSYKSKRKNKNYFNNITILKNIKNLKLSPYISSNFPLIKSSLKKGNNNKELYKIFS